MIGSHTFVIAEAGVNHNGSIERALDMVDAAAVAGADAVKFQTFVADRLVTRDARKAGYQLETTDESESQHSMLARLELSEEDHVRLMARCAEKGIEFLSAAFDLESVALLSKLGVRTLKVPSGELTNVPYLRAVSSAADRVLLSTGMATLHEVEEALTALESVSAPALDVVILQCTTEYPTPPEDVNLLAMKTMHERLGVPVGYSDHTQGVEVAVAAVALGAVVVEKHFTLDRTLPGPDHQASLEPDELKTMIDAIRRVEIALGDGVKAPTALEKENAAVVRKSIVAAVPIDEGDIFSATNVTTKRPGTGVTPMLWDELMGRTATRAYDPDEPIDSRELT